MENNYYQIYMGSVMQLASSMVIKSSDTAAAINIGLKIAYGNTAVDDNDPTTWKYYLNMVGQYHPRDTLMQVISVDTLQTIDFTRENLQFHRGTAKAYAYGSTYYKELVNRFPNQEQLILGILYPAADLDTCINAANGTILSYPTHLVEEWEKSLIPNVEKWVKSYLARWYNVQYTISDDLYAAGVLGIMYMNLIPAICMARLAMTKTNEAHSYHIRQYLASHGMLDKFVTYLTRKQQLWLYRNIKYVFRHSGMQDTFNWLIQNILTDRGLPIARFEMRHDLSDQLTNLLPELSFEKIPMNTDYNYDQVNQYELKAMFDKEDPLARDNIKYRDDEQLRAQRLMQYSKDNTLGVKLLESTIIDYAGSEHYTLADTLLYHWIYLSSTGHYRAYVQVTSPVTNETISLTAKEAFEFYIYASCNIIGIELDKLPAVIAKRVIRTPRPSIDDLMIAADERVVSRSFAEEMIGMVPTPQPMISVDSFYNYCVELQKAALGQYYIVCQETRMDTYGQKTGVINRCWADTGVQTGTAGQYYVDWFAERNILISEFTKSDLATIATDLLAAATGVDSGAAVTLKDIQQAMIRIMAQLSSYSVQYIAKINDGPVTDANTGSIRYDDYGALTHSRIIKPVDVRLLQATLHPKTRIDYDLSPDQQWDSLTQTRMTIEADSSVGISFAPKSLKTSISLKAATGMTYDLGELPPNPRNLTPVLGIDKFLLLTLEQQLSVPSLW